MAQSFAATGVAKTFAEFEYVGLHGTPYAVIVTREREGKYRLYKLDTAERLYYPLAEWDKGDQEAWNRWYESLCAIDAEIRRKREEATSVGTSLQDLDKVEQIVPGPERMIADVAQDDWSHR
jgi:DNA-binding transcriptional ArsR family regulator